MPPLRNSSVTTTRAISFCNVLNLLPFKMDWLRLLEPEPNMEIENEENYLNSQIISLLISDVNTYIGRI